ncbi:MAG: exo-alpha-sialidase [Polaromonas sp.]|nr:exo-alpha-sialidase [Polaromonas sp.]
MDRLLALLLVVAFGLAAWKINSREQSVSFASPSQNPVRVTPVTNSVVVGKSQVSADGRFRFDAQFVSGAPGRAVHAASLVELQSGNLRAVWFSGSREGAGDVAIQTAVMDHTTLRWSTESTLFERHQIERGLWRYVKKIGNPVIARAPDGSLVLWMVNVSLGGWAGSAVTWARSLDDGTSWSAPRRLVTSPFLNVSTLVKGAPIAFADGQIGLPVYHEFISKFAEILRLDAQGRVVDKVRIPGSQTSLQPVVLVTAPEKAQVYMRSGNAKALMSSSTEDAGKTWTATRATSLPNPDSAVAAVVTPAGEQWLALNPTTNNRETLALVVAAKGSTADAASLWVVESPASPKKRLLVSEYQALLGEELKASGVGEADAKAFVASARRQLCGQESCSQEFSYPYLLQGRDGYVHLIYTWHRTRIKHLRFDPSQIALFAKPVTANGSPAN